MSKHFVKINKKSAARRLLILYNSLETQFLSHDDNLDPSCGTAVAGDQDLVADAALAEAVGAGTVDTAGGIRPEALLVGGQ